MAYTTKNFKTKKELKEAVELWNKWNAENKSAQSHAPMTIGAVFAHKQMSKWEGRIPQPVYCFQPGPFGTDLSNFTGKVYLEGPHYPKPHSWYAEAWMEGGKVVKVK